MVIKKKAGRISPVFMGDYDNTTIYRRLDWVYYGGTSYICKKNNTTGIVPSDIEKWQKIIELPTELDMIFEEAATRENIASGDKLSVVLGKIKKWYSDLKKVAFTGKFEDLVEKPGVVTKTENGLVQKGDGQANKVWKTDANGNPAWRDDENTQAVTSVNNKTGAITLSAKDVKAAPAGNRIEKLTNINEITSIGFWTISAIDSNYASSIGIDNNTGDFHALVLSYNGNGTNAFNFGTVILSSPRISTYHYEIQVWEGAAQAIKTLNNKNILNTTEQISANTNNINIAGALALKAAIADYTNKLNAINSNLYYKSGDVIEYRYYLWICGTLTGGNKEIWITIPLNKPILGTPKITLTPYMFIVRQNGLYLKNITSSTDFIDSGIEVQTRGHVNGTGITFIFVEHNGFGGDNNDAVAVCMAYKITFV